ncbi:hypothetical protein FG05_04897 [Fusarium graminearum]|nr:hypothetical protein FG05_04897 [Fusarium graminearum]
MQVYGTSTPQRPPTREWWFSSPPSALSVKEKGNPPGRLSLPIPRSSVELGRLVLDPKYPNQDFCQPTIKKDPTQGDQNATGFEIETQQFKDFRGTVTRAKGTRLEASLLNILSLAPSSPKSTSTTVTGPLCVLHQLGDTNAFFKAACQQTHVRIWLEEQSWRLRSTVYLVCGFEALADANVSLAREDKTSLDMSVNVPSALLTAPTGVPVPGLDVGAGVSVSRESSENVEYTAVGEQVFSIQYRKISFSWFSPHKVDKAHLEKGNRWVSCMSTRSGQGDDECIECEVAEPIAPSDLVGKYESVEIDGETILYKAEI